MAGRRIIRTNQAVRLGASVLALACSAAESRVQDSAASRSTTHAPIVVDSARSMAEMVERFQRGSVAVARLTPAADSREALVRHFVLALEEADTAALAALVINKAEFGHLYFPTSLLAKPPYELDPALAWFQMRRENERGLGRILARFRGKPVGYRSHRCGPRVQAEGTSRIWRECVMTWQTPQGEVTDRVFMSIIEHGGQFKFFSYANRL